MATAIRRGLADHVHQAPAESVVVQDDRLRLVLGYYREGLGTGSPYFKFLAFWNSLEVACEDVPGGLQDWIRETMHEFPDLGRHSEPTPKDWCEHLRNERRDAVAHAVREPRREVPDLDPDNPDSRSRFHNDARMLDDLVRLRVRERWGDHAVYFRRRP